MNSLNFGRIIHPFKYLNIYSWVVLIAFIAGAYAMHSTAPGRPFEGVLMVSPIIALVIYWSEMMAFLVRRNDNTLSKLEIFYRDLFMVGFAFFIAIFVSFIFESQNTDLKGWWPLVVYILCFYGLIFSSLFSICSALLPAHKIYTIIFSILVFILFSFEKIFPRKLLDIDTFWVILGGLLGLHILISVIFRLFAWRQSE